MQDPCSYCSFWADAGGKEYGDFRERQAKMIDEYNQVRPHLIHCSLQLFTLESINKDQHKIYEICFLKAGGLYINFESGIHAICNNFPTKINTHPTKRDLYREILPRLTTWL